MSLMPQKIKTPQRAHDIIQYILNVNEVGIRNALAEDPNCINAVHIQSGMNAAMLCVIGRLPHFFNILINTSGSFLDFSYEDLDGDDLQELAFSTLNRGIIDSVQDAYERYAPHVINNWPSP